MIEMKKDIGVWEKKSKEGKQYWTGKMPDGKPFSMFRNEYKKEGDNQPTFRILINEPKVQTETQNNDDLPF